MDKILFFDIDGTLGQHGVITESNLKALHLLKEKGYYTFKINGSPNYDDTGIDKRFVLVYIDSLPNQA